MLNAVGRLQITPRQEITPRRAARTIQTAMIRIEKNFRHGHARNCTSSYPASSEVDASRQAHRQQRHGHCSGNSVGISILQNRQTPAHTDRDAEKQRHAEPQTQTRAHTEDRRTETATRGDRDRGAQTQRHTQTQKRTQRHADTGARACTQRRRCWSMATATATTATCKT